MKIYFWNLLFIVLCFLLPCSNYELVIPKHYDHYSVWGLGYFATVFYHAITIIAFLGAYYFKKNKFCNFCYFIALAFMVRTNVLAFIIMNPFNGNSNAGYKDTIWQSYYPEPVYIFVLSFIIIGTLFFIKNTIDNRRKNVCNTVMHKFDKNQIYE